MLQHPNTQMFPTLFWEEPKAIVDVLCAVAILLMRAKKCSIFAGKNVFKFVFWDTTVKLL